MRFLSMVVVFLTVFTLFFYFTDGLIACQKCSEIKCEKASCTSGQVLKKKAYCNCCDVCFTILGEGQRCRNFGIGGGLYPYECGENLVCQQDNDYLWTCHKQC